MEHLFFNSDSAPEEIGTTVFNLLGVSYETGDSKNVLNDTFYEASLLGLKLRIEENCYDYEDEYRFMLSVKRNALTDTKVRDSDVINLARAVQHLLADNLELDVAIEVESSLQPCSQSQ